MCCTHIHAHAHTHTNPSLQAGQLPCSFAMVQVILAIQSATMDCPTYSLASQWWLPVDLLDPQVQLRAEQGTAHNIHILPKAQHDNTTQTIWHMLVNSKTHPNSCGDPQPTYQSRQNGPVLLLVLGGLVGCCLLLHPPYKVWGHPSSYSHPHFHISPCLPRGYRYVLPPREREEGSIDECARVCVPVAFNAHCSGNKHLPISIQQLLSWFLPKDIVHILFIHYC